MDTGQHTDGSQESSTAATDGVMLDDFWAHDPFVLAHRPTGRYHLYTATKGQPRVEVWTSADLLTWHGPTTVFEVPDGGWADANRGPWAPEVHEHDGRFYLFTTLHDPARALPPVSDGSTSFTATDGSGRHSFAPSARATMIAVADSPLGPFELLDADRPVTDPDLMTLDGTLFVDPAGQPWLVYAHEWVQVLDGTIEAVPLSPDLRTTAGPTMLLLRGSVGADLSPGVPGTRTTLPYVTDGPQLRRLPGGALAMLWSTYRRAPGTGGADGVPARNEYVQTWALSRSGELGGPWEQRDVLVGGNAGHGMLVETFDGELLLVLHRPMGGPRVRAEIHRVTETSEGLSVVGPWPTQG